MVNQDIKKWENDELYADVFKKRATGELPEMESSKAAAKRLNEHFSDGDSILDVGCGAGHYFRSYNKFLEGRQFEYTGVDITKEYIEIAKEVFAGKDNINFLVASLYELPFDDRSFDVVVCNNVLLHLPEVKKAIKELMRVTKKVLIIRALVGDRSVYIKSVHAHGLSLKEDIIDQFEESGEPKDFFYYNIYSNKYMESLIKNCDPDAGVTISPDQDFDVGSLERNKDDFGNRENATTLINGLQVNGYIIMPWSFITVIK